MPMRPWPDCMNGWLWIGAFLLAAVAVAFAWRVGRYLIKRVMLLVKLTADSRRGNVTLRPRHPLWWLCGRRLNYDLLVNIPAPDTGRTAHTLAVKVIPTLRKTTEYCIGDMDRWDRKTNYLMPTARGVMMFDFGYRKCLSRPVDRVFLNAPAGVIRVYLFYPHPHALTFEHRGEDRHNAYRGVSEKCIPLWHEGVLCLDLDTLRKLELAEPDVRTSVLTPFKA
ncbi:MAG: hypothetical protein IKU90_07370 [Clostridia bacterium]|nr:hypothetical protein [Clostridia bacterium]